MSSPVRFQKIQTNMTIDTEKAKRALDALSQERQAQQHRLHLAAQAKRELDASRTQLPNVSRVL